MKKIGWVLFLIASCSKDAEHGDELGGDWGSTHADSSEGSSAGTDGSGGSDASEGGDAMGSSDDGPPGCPDADGDGSADASCGGGDCNDGDDTIFPGADDNDDFAWRLDSPGITCGGPITVDDEGTAHMLCAPQAPGVGLRHASNPTGLWLNEEIDAAPSASGSIAVGADGVVHVAYAVTDVGELRHASTADGSWSTETVEVFAPQHTGIAVDAAGAVHIVYSGGYDPSSVHYATNESGTFLTEHVEDTELLFNGTPVAIAIADDGPHIIHRDLVGAVRHGARVGAGWALENVAPAGMPSDGSFFAVGNELHVAYTQTSVFVGKRDASGWDIEEVAPQSYDSVDIAVGPDGKRHTVFRDVDSTHYASDTAMPWPIEDIESPGRPSIAVDLFGRIHVSLDRSATATGLGYARRVPPDGIDQNCDGVDGLDGDGDGFASVATGGGDCDDERVNVYPGAPDAPDDGLDQNCDGEGGA
jgi:hypothetical protein